MKIDLIARLTFLLSFILSCPLVRAEESNQPYIDQLNKEMGGDQPAPPSSDPESYIRSIRKEIDAENPPEATSKSYIEELRATDPLKLKPEPEVPYTVQEKEKLEPVVEASAIEALAEGRSELKPKFKGNIHHAFGLRYSVSMDRNYRLSGSSSSVFESIYGENYAPNFAAFYEFQPFHSEWFGNIGIFGMAGVGYYHSQGKFGIPLTNPSGGEFPSQSKVNFQFYTIPVTIGLDYRFNLLRILRPYVMVGPTVIGYLENRDDDVKGYRGNSRGLFASVGTALALDWIFPGTKWDMYSNYGFHHVYLNLDYSRLWTFSGNVQFASNGLTAGLTFEY